MSGKVNVTTALVKGDTYHKCSWTGRLHGLLRSCAREGRSKSTARLMPFQRGAAKGGHAARPSATTGVSRNTRFRDFITVQGRLFMPPIPQRPRPAAQPRHGDVRRGPRATATQQGDTRHPRVTLGTEIMSINIGKGGGGFRSRCRPGPAPWTRSPEDRLRGEGRWRDDGDPGRGNRRRSSPGSVPERKPDGTRRCTRSSPEDVPSPGGPRHAATGASLGQAARQQVVQPLGKIMEAEDSDIPNQPFYGHGPFGWLPWAFRSTRRPQKHLAILTAEVRNRKKGRPTVAGDAHQGPEVGQKAPAELGREPQGPILEAANPFPRKARTRRRQIPRNGSTRLSTVLR